MKRILLTLALLLHSAVASAQCSGVFGPNQVCGSILGGFVGAVPFTSVAGAAVPSIAALRALQVPADGTVINVANYYAGVSGGGGQFLYVAASALADNGGSIIAPNAGSGRYIRWVYPLNNYSPEMFGARHDGSDDQPFLTATATAISAVGKGTVWLSDPYTYTIGPSFASGKSVLQWLPNVNYNGFGTLKLAANTNATVANGGDIATFTGTCSGTTLTVSGVTGTIHIGDFIFAASGMPGANQVVSGTGPYTLALACTSSGLPMTATTKFARMIEAVSPTNVSDVSMKNITLDYNGLFNNCSVDNTAANGTCWAFNAMASIQVGTNIILDNVKFLNNSGSNDTEFGLSQLPPTVSNLRLVNLIHSTSGDRVNKASADFSADFFVASNVTLNNIACYNGPTVNGSCFEIHGNQVAASNIVSRDYFNCGIIANETTSPSTNNVTLSNITCLNVNYGGIQIYSRASANSINTTIDNMQVLFLTGKAGYGVDACSVVNATSTNINLNVNKLTYFSDLTTSNGLDTSGVCVSNFISASVTNSQFYNTQGPGVRFLATQANSVLNASGNAMTNPGRTATAALQAGVVFDSSANTAAAVSVQNNVIGGTVQYAVIGALNATGGLVSNNTAPGAVVDTYNWTGTGTTVVKYPAGVYAAVGDSLPQTITNKTGVKSSSFQLANTFASSTAPTISAGFCTSPSVSANNGTAAFAITVGSACAAGTGTITLPAATTGWVCDFQDVTTPGTNVVGQTGGTTTTVTVQNFLRTGAAANFNSGDVIRVKCTAY